MPPRRRNYGGSRSSSEFVAFSGRAQRLQDGDVIPSGQADPVVVDDDDGDDDEDINVETYVSSIARLSLVATGWLKTLHRQSAQQFYRKVEEFVLQCAMVSSRSTAGILYDKFEMYNILVDMQVEWAALREMKNFLLLPEGQSQSETDSDVDEPMQPFILGSGHAKDSRHSVAKQAKEKRKLKRKRSSSSSAPMQRSESTLATQIGGGEGSGLGSASTLAQPICDQEGSGIGSTSSVAPTILDQEGGNGSTSSVAPTILDEEGKNASESSSDPDEIKWRCYTCRFIEEDDAEYTHCPSCGTEWESTIF